MSCCAGPIVGDLAGTISGNQSLEEIRASGRQLSDGAMLYSMSVPAIHCGACVTTIERELGRLRGVRKARVNLTLRTLLLTLENESTGLAPFVARLHELGYPPLSVEAGEGQDEEYKSLMRALAVAGFAATNVMLLSVAVWTGAEGATRDLFHFISALIALPAVAYAGQPFFRSAIAALRQRRMNMDVPISLGVILATVMSLFESLRSGEHAYFDAAVSLLFFLLIGRTLDHLMRARARHLVSQLARLSAKGGMVIGPDGTSGYVALNAIRPGMLLRVAAGERVPVDAEIVVGETEVDRSFVTGESNPIPAAPGTSLEAGTMNLTGVIDIRATRLASQSFLADVMQMMSAAEQGRGLYIRIADRIAQIYSPLVHIIAAATFAGWMFATHAGWHQSLTVAISVLIITCPCALGLAVPVAHVIGASRLFRAGILMKDGSALERMAEVDHAAFDKTGTLTTGEPVVANSDIPRGDLQSVARSLAAHSLHPASRALARHFAAARPLPLAGVREIPGHGILATWNGREVRLGRMDWVSEIASSPGHGSSGTSFAIAGGPAYSVEITEQLRTGARKLVSYLDGKAIGCEILSGDAPPAVARIASSLGISVFRSGLRPADKVLRLTELSGLGQKVLMVGDGLNDAPSLAAAHVSMAPSSASDIGRNAADFVFTRGDLEAAAFAHGVALQARKIVRQNFGLAIAYNAFAVPLAVLGYLNPLIAAVAMSSSSVIVIANSMRLLHAKAGSAEARQEPAARERRTMELEPA